MWRNIRIQPWPARALMGVLLSLAVHSKATPPDEQPAAANTTNKVVAPLILSGRSSKAESSAKISTPVTDVLNLLDAKVSPDVIKAYIKNLSMASNPTADELIKLTERGASTDILLDLLQRGAEVMARTPQTLPIAYYQFPAPTPTYASEPEATAANPAPVIEEAPVTDASDPPHTESIILGGPGAGFPGPPVRHPREHRQDGRRDHPPAHGSGPGIALPHAPPPAAAPHNAQAAPASGFGGRSR